MALVPRWEWLQSRQIGRRRFERFSTNLSNLSFGQASSSAFSPFGLLQFSKALQGSSLIYRRLDASVAGLGETSRSTDYPSAIGRFRVVHGSKVSAVVHETNS